MVTKAHLLAEIRRTAAENGGTPLGWRRFEAATGIMYHDWCGKHFARWGDAIREAGLEPNKLSVAYSDTALYEALASLTRALGHFPTSDEIKLAARRDGDFPSEKVFRRLGTRNARVVGLARFCAEHPGYEDVASICAAVPLPSGEAEAEPSDVSAPAPVGFVYLMRSGRFYKVGRSNAVGRRERELAIQLPEKASVVHSIATDDPPGIEAYWHRRFAEKRANGEWFALTADDVAAFKRRKFM
jgi:hypothetical protein